VEVRQNPVLLSPRNTARSPSQFSLAEPRGSFDDRIYYIGSRLEYTHRTQKVQRFFVPFQRALAAFLAMALRLAFDRLDARALPRATAAGLAGGASSISPVASLPTSTASSFMSRGRFGFAMNARYKERSFLTIRF